MESHRLGMNHKPIRELLSEWTSVTLRRERLRRLYTDGPPMPGSVSPTRFGDWEYAGRCTDF
jgi:hypothetical protein